MSCKRLVDFCFFNDFTSIWVPHPCNVFVIFRLGLRACAGPTMWSVRMQRPNVFIWPRPKTWTTARRESSRTLAWPTQRNVFSVKLYVTLAFLWICAPFPSHLQDICHGCHDCHMSCFNSRARPWREPLHLVTSWSQQPLVLWSWKQLPPNSSSSPPSTSWMELPRWRPSMYPWPSKPKVEGFDIALC